MKKLHPFEARTIMIWMMDSYKKKASEKDVHLGKSSFQQNKSRKKSKNRSG
jgi:hypothetical protein